MASSKTAKINEKTKRIQEIAETFRGSQLEIDDLLPLVDEALKHHNEIKERLDNILKSLEEKEKTIKQEG